MDDAPGFLLLGLLLLTLGGFIRWQLIYWQKRLAFYRMELATLAQNGIDDATPPCCIQTRTELTHAENVAVRFAFGHMLLEVAVNLVTLGNLVSVGISMFACAGAWMIVGKAKLVRTKANGQRPKLRNNFLVYSKVLQWATQMRAVDIVLQIMAITGTYGYDPYNGAIAAEAGVSDYCPVLFLKI